MTTFEILTIVFYAVVVMIGYLVCRGIATVIDNQQEMDSNPRKMDAGLDKRLEDISQQLVAMHHNVHDDNSGIISQLRRIYNLQQANSTFKDDKAEKAEEGEPLVVPFISPGATTWPPCYVGGPCTNPHHDCINCPRPNVSGGIWTTTLKAEGEMFQEKFNDNKED